MTTTPLSRREQKERTRRAILDASLSLSSETTLAALSLRSVAKQVGIVPTAFYRHFDSVDDVGLALADECFAELRAMLRDVRAGVPGCSDVIDDSLSVVVEHIQGAHSTYAFIGRERVAGPPRVRAAIQHEIELITRELATDLARLPGTDDFSSQDLNLLADVLVSVVVTTAERITAEPTDVERVVDATRTQLRMMLVGAANWQSD